MVSAPCIMYRKTDNECMMIFFYSETVSYSKKLPNILKIKVAGDIRIDYGKLTVIVINSYAYTSIPR